MNLAFKSSAADSMSRWLDAKLDDSKSALDFGAVGDDATDNYAAGLAALTYVALTGGAVIWPHGIYRFGQPLPPLSTRQGKFIGEGRGAAFTSNPSGPASSQYGTVFRADFENGDLLTLGSGSGNSACQFFEISDICFWPVKFRTGAEIKIAGASSCIFRRLTFAFCDVAMLFGPSASCITGEVYAFNCYGGVIRTLGQASIVNFSQGHVFEHVNTYNVLAYDVTRCFTAWAPSRVQQFNDALQANGWMWACTQAGTTAPSGAGPILPAFVFAGEPMQTDVADGTAKWRPIHKDTFTPFLMDSYSLFIKVRDSEFLQAYRGLAMVDSVGSGSAPVHLVAGNVLADHHFGDCFAFLAGQNVRAENAKATIGGRGFYFGAAFQGDARFAGGEAWACAQEGIKAENGPANLLFDGMQVGNNSVLTPNAYDGVDLACQHVVMKNCKPRPLLAGGSNQRYGIRLRSTVDYADVSGNDLSGNGTGPILDESNTINNSIQGNLGAVMAQTAITVGASPFTWTNKTGRAASVIVYNGAVSMVQLNGIRIGIATDISVAVPRGQTVTVTYSAAPNMAQSPIT